MTLKVRAIISYCVESLSNFTNAYMLMYRKVNLPTVSVGPAEIPDYISEMLDREDKVEQVQKQVPCDDEDQPLIGGEGEGNEDACEGLLRG